MKKTITLLLIFFNTILFSQEIDLYELYSFKTKGKSEIEDYLILKDWHLSKKFKSEGDYEGLYSEISYHYKNLNGEKSTLTIGDLGEGMFMESERDISLVTENYDIYKLILKNLIKEQFVVTDDNVFDTNIKFKRMRDKNRTYRLGQKITLEQKSSSKKYSKDRIKIILSIINYKTVKSINSKGKFDKLSKEIKTEYRVKIL